MKKNIVTTYQYEISEGIELQCTSSSDGSINISVNNGSDVYLQLDKKSAKNLFTALNEILNKNNKKSLHAAQDTLPQTNSYADQIHLEDEAIKSKSRFSAMLAEGSKYV